MRGGLIIHRPVLNIIPVAFMSLACIIQFALKYFQQTGLLFFRSLTIRRHGQKRVDFILKLLHERSLSKQEAPKPLFSPRRSLAIQKPCGSSREPNELEGVGELLPSRLLYPDRAR